MSIEFVCTCGSGCSNTFGGGPSRDDDNDVEMRARSAGWKFSNLKDGNGYLHTVACPRCVELGFFDAHAAMNKALIKQREILVQ